MCTLAVYFRVWETSPVVIAANRDEFLSRPASSPTLLDPQAQVFGGRDERAGGTWFGVNRRGLAAALLNRRTQHPLSPTARSRGLLCLDALRHENAELARASILREPPDTYNPFNLLVVDRDEAWVATNHERHLGVTPLAPGLHLLTNLDVNDSTCPKIARSVQLFQALVVDSPSAPPSLDAFQSILSSHDTTLDPRGNTPGNSLCVHAGEYATRSSTIVYFDRHDGWRYFHMDAPPCRGRYEERRMPWFSR